ncbi:MAG: site-2 protease family protein [Chloroflexi bacterium]|nr:site-2 protease family protein [Chloroflexota bacterium]
MFLFQTPPPTRFDLNLSVAGFPVRVHPLFWIMAILFGSSSGSPAKLLGWVIAVFVSITIHELGHALALRRYGQESEIILHMAGGLTVPQSISWGGRYASVSLSPNQQILVSLAGPFSGFLFAALLLLISLPLGGTIIPYSVLGFIPMPFVLFPSGWEILTSFFMSLLWVNIFWGFINLVPVHPLDGGSVVRYILIQTDPLNGLQTSLWVSVIAGAGMAIAGLLFLRSTYMAILFGLLAFQSFQALQSGAGRW